MKCGRNITVTNREWLNSLDDEKFAEAVIILVSGSEYYTDEEFITVIKWLKKEVTNA